MSTQPINKDALNRLFRARTVVNARLPYLRSTTMAMVPQEVPGLGTVATTPHMHFLYDPDFMLKITDDLMLGGVYLHEMLHQLKNHHARRLAFGLLDTGSREDLHLWNIAGDLENNRDIEASGLLLPGKAILGGDPCYARNFKRADGSVFPPDQLAETYYQWLKEARDAVPPPPPGSDPGGTADGPSRVGAGRCGSGCGAKVPGEPDGTDQGGRSKSEVDVIRKETAQAIRDQVASKGVGSVPGGLARWAEKADDELPVPWHVLLSRATTRAVSWAAGQVAYKYDRPSRRQAGLGYGAGSAILPALRRPIPTIWVGVDTSGSMGQKDVSVVLSVVEKVMQHTQKKVTFFTCDTAIDTLKEVASWREAVKLIKGGGGTDFRPVFEAAMSARPDKRPQVLVFVTDGCGPAPANPPHGIKVVWLLVGPYAQSPCKWGDQIRIPETGIVE